MISKEAIHFKNDLKNNNNTPWMHANKERYESYKKEYHFFINSLLIEMKKLDSALEPLEIKNCTFRINRDIRFSKDKTPYKTHIATWFPVNKSRKNSPGYYVHFEEGKSFIAAGIWGPEPADVKKIRREIAFFHEDLEKIIAKPDFKKEFGTITREENFLLKKAPKGYDPEHPAIELLKLKSYTCSQKIDDKLFSDKDFSIIIAKKLAILKDFNQFLNRAIETED